MTVLESILRQASGLSPTDRAKLIAALAEQAETEAQAEESLVGRRGLTALTRATQDEDWSDYYPQSLGELTRETQ